MRNRQRGLVIAASVLIILLSAGALPVAAQNNGFIVSFEPGTPRNARAAAAERHGAQVRFNYDIIDAVAVSVPNENAIRGLLGEASVRSITPDHPVHATPVAADPGDANANGKPGGGGGGTGTSTQVVPFGVQRVLKFVGAPSGSEGAGIGVAVVDTGIDINHTDLVVQADRYNALDGTTNCKDDNGHGTHVSGTIAAKNNSQDVVGVAPGVSLYCVKVLDAQGSGSWSSVIAGLDWIYNNGTPKPIKVVNMSLGGDGSADPTSPLEIAIANLYNKGIVVVVAAGNDPKLDVSQQVPAAYPEVLAIASATAVDGANNKCSVKILADTASYFTTDGGGVAISAPGEDSEDTKPGCLLSSVGILSLKLGGGTTRMSGTSMATPHVTGLVARILQAWAGSLKNDQTDVEAVRAYFRDASRGADRQNTAPLNSPTSSFTYDGTHEGIAVLR